jgi:hypothetical protein
MKLQFVPTQYCAQIWPQVEGYIAEASKHGFGDYTIDQIKLLVNMGQWLLMVATDDEGKIHGALTASFINYPNSRVAFVTSIGGRLISSQDTFRQMCEILKAEGATKIQGMARESVARLWKRYGFTERSTLVEVKI